MRPLSAISLATVLAVTFVATDTLAQDRAADTASVKALVASYVQAREQRDAAALSALFTTDADQLVSTGEWRKGREAVVAGGLASSARSSGVRTIEVETVRFVGADVAVADGRYEIGGTTGERPRRMWTTFVMVKRQTGWRISAIRNMRPTE